MEQNNQKPKYHPVHEVFDGVMNTRSGKTVDLLDPAADTICIEDITCALSKLCRFNGQVSTFYSVAQHSILVAALAPPALRPAALLHDAAEAYLGDMIKPLKVLMGAPFELLEKRFMQVIAEKFKINYADFAAIKSFDLQATTAEHEALQKGNMSAWYSLCLSAEISSTIYGPAPMESYFISEYYKIFGDDNK